MADGKTANWTRHLGRESLLVLAVLVGAVLRLHQISEQIIADDEWHALYAALHMGYGDLFTHFGYADHCIPLALLDRLLLDSVGLSELGMRAPMLMAGIGSLVVLPLLLRPLLGRAVSTSFAWLLAVAPLHIYVSRYARPYGIALFVATVGLLAAWRWWTGAGRRWAWLFAICAVLGPWFHLTILPVALAPFVFFGVLGLLGRRDARWWAAAGWLAAGVALGLLLLLGPPVVVDLPSVASKAAADVAITADTWRLAATFWGGTADDGLLLVVAGLAAVGAAALARRQPRFLAYVAFMACPQVVAVYLMHATLTQYPYILARYALMLLPLGLLLVSAGLAAIEAGVRRGLRGLPEGALAPVLAAVLLWSGPLGFAFIGPNNWTNHALYQYWYQPGAQTEILAEFVKNPAVDLYLKLGQLAPGSLRLVEAPWFSEWSNNYALAVSQRIHHQWIAIGFVGREDGEERFGEFLGNDERLRFRNFVQVGDAEGLKRRGVRLVIFHRDTPLQTLSLGEEGVSVEHWIERYRALYGRPIVEDEHTVAFDIGG